MLKCRRNIRWVITTESLFLKYVSTVKARCSTDQRSIATKCFESHYKCAQGHFPHANGSAHSSTAKSSGFYAGLCISQWWPNSRSRSTSRSQPVVWSIAAAFFKIAYLNHNWRCKLGMHELSSAERNARYRRFFELLNNPPGPYQVILNLLSVSYRKICSVMRQLHNRKVSEKQLLIMVNCLVLKINF
jgi:hypothetical protein